MATDVTCLGLDIGWDGCQVYSNYLNLLVGNGRTKWNHYISNQTLVNLAKLLAQSQQNAEVTLMKGPSPKGEINAGITFKRIMLNVLKRSMHAHRKRGFNCNNNHTLACSLSSLYNTTHRPTVIMCLLEQEAPETTPGVSKSLNVE